jgi:hypothetical protein
MIQNGLYRHFKGNLYEVTGTARHTETEEFLVLYHALGKPNEVFARPLTMFTDMVTPTSYGERVPRFKFEKTL